MRNRNQARSAWVRSVVALVLALLIAAPWVDVRAANLWDATGYSYWNDKTYSLHIVDGTLQVTEGGKTRVLSTYDSNVMWFFVSGTRVIYYARNKAGKSKWFVHDLKAKADTEYAFDTLEPFWGDADGVYTTTGGKRTYDYNVYRFDPKTGKKAKLAEVYGMPIGYVSGKLVALDYYHREIRWYKGSTLNTKIALSGLTHGFVIGGTVYAKDSGKLYRVKDGKLVTALEKAVMPIMRLNDAMLLGTIGESEYPMTMYLATASKVEEMGVAKDAAGVAAIGKKAIEKAKK